MQITLDQPEIELAVQQFVMNNFPFLAGQSVGIEFTATRGDKGITAALNISAAQITQTPAAPAAPKLSMPVKRTAAPAAVAQPKPAPAPVEEEVETQSEEAGMTVEDAVAAISTGEERVDPENADEGEQAAEEPAPKVNPFKKAITQAASEEAPAADEQPKAARSIFSKAS